jgi:hypothetical protein
MRLSDNNVLGRICGHNGQEVVGGRTEVQSDEFTIYVLQ